MKYEHRNRHRSRRMCASSGCDHLLHHGGIKPAYVDAQLGIHAVASERVYMRGV